MKITKQILQVLLGLAIVLTLTVVLFMQLPSFGKLPAGKRLERIKDSKNYRDGFVNLSPTEMLAENATYFRVFKKAMTPDKRRTPSKAIPSVKAIFPVAHRDKPLITWFGHSSYLVQVNGVNILVDPVFSRRTSFVQYLGPEAYPGTLVYSVKSLPPTDIVIISHDHYDHLDHNTILELKKTVKHFYVPLGVGAHLEYWGVPHASITELDWWEGAPMINGMHITATPARHFSGRGFTRNKTLWASFVLATGQHKIYIGGDSGYDTHFKEIGDKFGPFDLAVLENGQYDENWPFIHMMPEQTVQASIDLRAAALFPVHWGKFSLAAHPWDEPAIRVSKKAEEMKVKLVTPQIGEQIILDSIYPSRKWWYF